MRSDNIPLLPTLRVGSYANPSRLNHTARWLAFGKMCALVEGARRVRQELAG
ncbi:MAG: hypothetical protein ACE5JJ_06870 [Nitrospinota bacterium]